MEREYKGMQQTSGCNLCLFTQLYHSPSALYVRRSCTLHYDSYTCMRLKINFMSTKRKQKYHNDIKIMSHYFLKNILWSSFTAHNGDIFEIGHAVIN